MADTRYSLLFAARDGNLESGRILLTAGASANEEAANGASALVVAAHSGNGPFAALLLEHGANPNAAGAGYTALHAAVLGRPGEHNGRSVRCILRKLWRVAYPVHPTDPQSQDFVPGPFPCHRSARQRLCMRRHAVWSRLRVSQRG